VARTFDNVDDSVGCATGALASQTVANVTWVMVLRRAADGTAGLMQAFGGGSNRFWLTINSSNQLSLGVSSEGGSTSAFTVTAAEDWVLIALTKAAGTQPARFHKHVYATGASTHSAGSGSAGDGTAPGSGTWRFGSFFSTYINGDLAAAAVFPRVLDDQEIDNLAHSLHTWLASAPSAMWVFDQATVSQPVVDWTGGGANQSDITGTAVAASSAPIGYGHPTPLQVKGSVPAFADPPPLAASWTLPPPALSVGLETQPSSVLGSWTLPAPDIFVGSAPPTNVQPSPLVAPWTVPPPAVSVSVTIRPDPLVAVWSVPTPDVSVPINPGDDLDAPAQLSYNGFKIGSGTPYLIDRLKGWYSDMPGIDNGNVAHPSGDGAMSGRKLPHPRTVSAEIKVAATHDNIDQINLDFLAGLPLPDSDEELSLAGRVDDLILTGLGACVHRELALDRTLRDGYIPGIVIWELADPRLYSRDLSSATVADGGTVEVTNPGNRSTRPLVRCPGPAVTPRLEVYRRLADGTDDLRVIEFDLELADGDLLIIDVALGVATIGGDSQIRYLTGASVGLTDWVLGRGVSEVSYATVGGDAPPAVVLWRHAYL
jgi:hypothetical protein